MVTNLSKSLELLVNVVVISLADQKNNEKYRFPDKINDSILPDVRPPIMFVALQLGGIMRLWIGAKIENLGCDLPLLLRWKRSNEFLRPL